MAGVQGRHCVAEPVPLVGRSCGNGTRKLGACPRINVYRSLIPRQLYGVGVEMDIAVVSTSIAVSTSRFIGGMTPYKGILVEHMAPSM
jgi:hypothetical protein